MPIYQRWTSKTRPSTARVPIHSLRNCSFKDSSILVFRYRHRSSRVSAPLTAPPQRAVLGGAFLPRSSAIRGQMADGRSPRARAWLHGELKTMLNTLCSGNECRFTKGGRLKHGPRQPECQFIRFESVPSRIRVFSSSASSSIRNKCHICSKIVEFSFPLHLLLGLSLPNLIIASPDGKFPLFLKYTRVSTSLTLHSWL